MSTKDSPASRRAITGARPVTRGGPRAPDRAGRDGRPSATR
jgi:hypothetical protein